MIFGLSDTAQLAAAFAPILGVVGAFIASRISSRTAREGIVMSTYNDLVVNLRSQVEHERTRADLAEDRLNDLEGP